MDFVDPESVKLAFTFRNTDGSADMLCGSPDPSCFIERIQLFANGQRVEDVNYYGRSCFMYSLLKNQDWWTDLHWEGLPVDAGGWAQPVQPGQKRDVLMHPHLLGMFTAGKMLPPQLNLVIEIEFAEPEHAMRAGVGSSLSYTIENVQALGDQVTLDSALRESFERILLSNRSLIFSFPSLHVQQSSIPAGSTSFNVTVARAFTKLLGAFVTFNKTGENFVSNMEYPGEAFPNVSAATVMEGQLQLGAIQVPRICRQEHRRMAPLPRHHGGHLRPQRSETCACRTSTTPTSSQPSPRSVSPSTRPEWLSAPVPATFVASASRTCSRTGWIRSSLASFLMQIVTLSGSGVSVLD